MDQKRKKTINKFAVLVLLIILVPELVGHVLFDKPHSASSSVDAAISLTNKMNHGYHIANFGCRLAVHDDPTSSNVTRAAGLDGEYGTYDCGTS